MSVEPLAEEKQFPLELPILREAQIDERKNSTEFRKYFMANRSDFSYRMINGQEILFLRECMYVPKVLREKVVNWYHFFLCHPGSSRLYNTLKLNLEWPGMASRCVEHTRTCDVCQRYKKVVVNTESYPQRLYS